MIRSKVLGVRLTAGWKKHLKNIPPQKEFFLIVQEIQGGDVN